MELYEDIKREVEALETVIVCSSVVSSDLSGGRYIEVEFSAADTTLARREVDTLLARLYPKRKFSLLARRSKN